MSAPASPPAPPPGQLPIQIDDDVAQGAYINLAVVTHSETEFTLDLIYVQPQPPKAKVRARAITSPKHMKKLLLAIQEQVNRYEQRFGAIDVPTFPPGVLPQ